MPQRERMTNDCFLITPDNELHRLALSLDDTSAQSKTLSESVGGWLEAVYLNSNISSLDWSGTLFVDEDGLRKNLPFNQIASALAKRGIVGNAVFTGAADGNGDITPLAQAAILDLWEVAKRYCEPGSCEIG